MAAMTLAVIAMMVTLSAARASAVDRSSGVVGRKYSSQVWVPVRTGYVPGRNFTTDSPVRMPVLGHYDSPRAFEIWRVRRAGSGS